jgi:hypothetical protein
METNQRQPKATVAAEPNKDMIVITLFALNDPEGKPRILRLVVEAGDGSVVAAIEDGNEDGALARAGFADCTLGPHFFVDSREYERVLESSGEAGATSP